MRFSSILIVATLAHAPVAHGAEWRAINTARDIPDQVLALLSDCSFVTQSKAEWLNGDNLAKINLGKSQVLWFSTCEASASQTYTALVLQAQSAFTRLKLPQLLNGTIQNNLDLVAGATWKQSSQTLSSVVSAGCASEAGGNYLWKWENNSFILVEQAESDDCIGQDNWPVVYSRNR